MARLTTKSAYGTGKQAKQSPANKGEYMKLIDLAKIIYPVTEMEFFNNKGQSLGYCTDILEIPIYLWYEEVDYIGTNGYGILEIYMK